MKTRLRVRRSPHTLQVIDVFLENPKDWIHGYDIGRRTGLMSGTLYPILMRLAENKLLETRWETPDDGRPRHVYRFTADGLQYARELRASCEGDRKAALHGAKT
jgi:PadR family transcriptional regulator, regulatory protein PadR